MGYEVVNKEEANKVSIKAAMLGVDVDKQIEALNKMYENKIELGKSHNTSYGDTIQVVKTADNVIKLVLPENKNFDLQDLFPYLSFNNKSLVSVELPRCIDTLRLRECRWVNRIERIFVHEGTVIDFDKFEKSLLCRLTMIAVLPDDKNKKAKVYKI